MVTNEILLGQTFTLSQEIRINTTHYPHADAYREPVRQSKMLLNTMPFLPFFSSREFLSWWGWEHAKTGTNRVRCVELLPRVDVL